MKYHIAQIRLMLDTTPLNDDAPSFLIISPYLTTRALGTQTESPRPDMKPASVLAGTQPRPTSARVGLTALG